MTGAQSRLGLWGSPISPWGSFAGKKEDVIDATVLASGTWSKTTIADGEWLKAVVAGGTWRKASVSDGEWESD